MEYRELYTRSGENTGRILEKHAPRQAGQYFLHTIVILKTDTSPLPGQGEGLYVMQQRSLKARYYAGKWDVTGGSVKAGETPQSAAVREAQEELGLHIPQTSLKLFHTFRVDWEDGTGLFISVYACRVHVPESGIRFDPYEVHDVQIVPFHEFYTHVMDHNDEDFGIALRKIEAEI